MTATHPIVDAYVAAVNASDPDALLACFAPDGVLNHPLGTFAGADLAGFYRDVVLAGQAVLTPGAVVVDGTLVFAELTATSPLDADAGVLHAVDVFRLGDAGRIASLDIYYR